MPAIDPLTVGIVVGILVGAPMFASVRLAAGLLLQLGIVAATIVITSGFKAAIATITSLIEEIAARPQLALGVMLGFVVAGLLSMYLRGHSHLN
jgi:hypothetical protein